MIDRRRFLKASALLGLLVPIAGMAGELPVPLADYGSAQGLGTRGTLLIGLLCETIIPKTTTPGARDVGVPKFIDMILAKWATPEQQQRFLVGLADLDRTLTTTAGSAFETLSPAKRELLLADIDRAAYPLPADGTMPFVVLLKSLTVAGYYTTEAGASEELTLIGVSGEYKACVHRDGHDHAESVQMPLRIVGF